MRQRFRLSLPTLAVLALLAPASAAQDAFVPPSLQSARIEGAPWSVQAGGIAAFDVALDERGTVRSASLVQDVAPYAALLGQALPAWSFAPAREGGRAVESRVLVIGFFRPPMLNFPAPERPRYKDVQAPPEIPWPTEVGVPPYPPNVLGDGRVLVEADVSAEGAVTSTRVVWPGTPFDSAADQATRAWKFRPASRAGRAVPARVFLLFSFAGVSL
jgi:TonB family protein